MEQEESSYSCLYRASAGAKSESLYSGDHAPYTQLLFSIQPTLLPYYRSSFDWCRLSCFLGIFYPSPVWLLWGGIFAYLVGNWEIGWVGLTDSSSLGRRESKFKQNGEHYWQPLLCGVCQDWLVGYETHGCECRLLHRSFSQIIHFWELQGTCCQVQAILRIALTRGRVHCLKQDKERVIGWPLACKFHSCCWPGHNLFF